MHTQDIVDVNTPPSVTSAETGGVIVHAPSLQSSQAIEQRKDSEAAIATAHVSREMAADEKVLYERLMPVSDPHSVTRSEESRATVQHMPISYSQNYPSSSAVTNSTLLSNEDVSRYLRNLESHPPPDLTTLQTAAMPPPSRPELYQEHAYQNSPYLSNNVGYVRQAPALISHLTGQNYAPISHPIPQHPQAPISHQWANDGALAKMTSRYAPYQAPQSSHMIESFNQAPRAFLPYGSQTWGTENEAAVRPLAAGPDDVMGSATPGEDGKSQRIMLKFIV